LRLWRSDVLVQNGGHMVPLWTGSISDERLSRVLAVLTIARSGPATIQDLSALAAALPAARLAKDGGMPVVLAWEPAAQNASH
jgi:hypothetical protein